MTLLPTLHALISFVSMPTCCSNLLWPHSQIAISRLACWLQSKAQATKDDLMNRLSNACKQRDAAREEALLSSEKLAKLQEDIDSGALQPASAAPAPQPAAPPPAMGASSGVLTASRRQSEEGARLAMPSGTSFVPGQNVGYMKKRNVLYRTLDRNKKYSIYDIYI